jgi:hypothetical protein
MDKRINIEADRLEFEAAMLAHFGEGETFERDKEGCYVNRSWHDAFIGWKIARATPTATGATDLPPLLTDEQIEHLWARHADTAESGKRRLAFGRAVESAVLAHYQRKQASQETVKTTVCFVCNGGGYRERHAGAGNYLCSQCGGTGQIPLAIAGQEGEQPTINKGEIA